jgi:hypothetical protein
MLGLFCQSEDRVRDEIMSDLNKAMCEARVAFANERAAHDATRWKLTDAIIALGWAQDPDRPFRQQYTARPVTSNGTTMLRNDYNLDGSFRAGGGGGFSQAACVPQPHNDAANEGLARLSGDVLDWEHAHLSGSGTLTAVANAMDMTW